MSIQAVGAVLDHSKAKKSARLVAISIANHVDKHGVGYISIRLIEEESLLTSRTTVRNSIVAMRDDLGELVVLVEAEGKTHRPPLYWLKLPGLSGEVAGDHPYFLAYGSPEELGFDPGSKNDPGPGSDSDPAPGQEMTPPRVKDCPHPGSNSDAGPYREPSKSRPKAKSDPSSPDPVQEIYDFWKSATGRNGHTQLTDGRRRAIRARLGEGRPPEFIKQAVANVAASDWYMKRGKYSRRDGQPHDDLTLICRNGEQLEQYARMGGGEASTVAPASRIVVAGAELADEEKAIADWEAAKERLRPDVSEESFATWCEPLEAAGVRDGRLVLVDSSEQGGGRWTRDLRRTLLPALDGYADVEIVDEVQLEYEAR
ncbi:MAG TPA: hypothetical protein VFN92_08155 [Solirubrobacterales bacterium]|nr:hypothetical protein [Solirubrobacterales bacterium]